MAHKCESFPTDDNEEDHPLTVEQQNMVPRAMAVERSLGLSPEEIQQQLHDESEESDEILIGDGSQEKRRPLTDDELDTVLRRADKELLRHIAATVDVEAGLRQITGGEVAPPENPGPVEQA